MYSCLYIRTVFWLVFSNSASVLSAPLTFLCKLSVENLIFPNILKNSNVLPIQKFYTKFLFINNFSKALEISLYQPSYNHVRNTKTEKKHGFMGERSTPTNRLCKTQFITDSFDNNLIIYANSLRLSTDLTMKSYFQNWTFSVLNRTYVIT